jgi:hypothetical protein
MKKYLVLALLLVVIQFSAFSQQEKQQGKNFIAVLKKKKLTEGDNFIYKESDGTKLIAVVKNGKIINWKGIDTKGKAFDIKINRVPDSNATGAGQCDVCVTHLCSPHSKKTCTTCHRVPCN